MAPIPQPDCPKDHFVGAIRPPDLESPIWMAANPMMEFKYEIL